MRAIATLLILVVLISVSVPAQAGGKDWLGVGLAGLILLLGSGGNDNSAYVSAPVRPVPVYLAKSSRSLGNVEVREVSGPSGAEYAVRGVLEGSGWVLINDRARQAAEEETQRYGSSGIQPKRVTHYVYVTSETRDGRMARRWNRNGGSNSEEEVRERICTLDLTISSAAGDSVSARAIGTSWSTFSSWSWNGYYWGYAQENYTPSDDDWAFLAALMRASNEITARLAGQTAQAAAAPQVKPCVAEIRDGFIYINLGSAQGVQEGDRFDVLGGDPIKDPNTGEVLGTLAKCQLKIERVFEKMSRCDLTVDDYPDRLCRPGDPIAPAK